MGWKTQRPGYKLMILLAEYDSWVIGSAAAPDCDYATVRDFDIIIPWEKWDTAVNVILRFATQVKANSFGGWKVYIDEDELDIWPGTLQTILARPQFSNYAWHPKSDTRIQKL